MGVTGALAAMDAATKALRAATSDDAQTPKFPFVAQQLALILEHGGPRACTAPIRPHRKKSSQKNRRPTDLG